MNSNTTGMMADLHLQESRLRPHVLEKVAEKMFASAPYFSGKIRPVDFLKMKMLSKATSRAFDNSSRENLMLIVGEELGRLYFKRGALLGKPYKCYGHLASKWTNFWMLTQGLFKEIGVRFTEDAGMLTAVELRGDESPLESLARLIFTEGREFERLDMGELDKRVALPSVSSCDVYRMMGEGFVLPWSTINRIFNLNAEDVSIMPNSPNIGSPEWSLNADMRASAHKSIQLSMVTSESREDLEDFGVFGLLDNWKRLFLHCCRVSPNLEGLDFEVNGIQFGDPDTNLDRMVAFLEKINGFFDFVYDEVLPEMPNASVLNLSLDFITHHFGESLLDGLKGLALARDLRILEEDNCSLMLRSNVNWRFEIRCSIWDW